jgi:hypothetical protein
MAKRWQRPSKIACLPRSVIRAGAQVEVTIGGVVPEARVQRKGMKALRDAVAEAVDRQRLVSGQSGRACQGRHAGRGNRRRDRGTAAARDRARALRAFRRMILAPSRPFWSSRMIVGWTERSILGWSERSTRCFLGRADAVSAAARAKSTARPRIKTFNNGTRIYDEIDISPWRCQRNDFVFQVSIVRASASTEGLLPFTDLRFCPFAPEAHRQKAIHQSGAFSFRNSVRFLQRFGFF